MGKNGHQVDKMTDLWTMITLFPQGLQNLFSGPMVAGMEALL